MSNPVSALSHSIALMRRALSETRQGAPVARAEVDRQRGKVKEVPQRKQLSALPQRLETLTGLADEERRRRALRLFLEAVLMDELGEENVLSAEFGDLVERVASSLEETPSARKMLAEALDELLVNR